MARRRVVYAASASAHCLPEIYPSRSCGAADGAPWGADLSAGCKPCAAGRPTAEDGLLYRAHHVRVSVRRRESPASHAARPLGRTVERRPFPTRALAPALAPALAARVSAARVSASAVSESSV